jgi:DNA-binding CsgD family transcriptional regulator
MLPTARRSDAFFVGRGDELAAIAAAAETAAAGRAQVVWIEGGPGSGKTALVRRALALLPAGFAVMHAEADELESDASLTFARQFGALVSDNAFSVGLELLALFDERESDGPVAVVAEDLHWADSASRVALLTALRRLQDDGVLVLVTSRPQALPDDRWERFTFDPDRCRRIVLGALAADDVRALADDAGITLTQRQAERLFAHTNGHPLYVRTLLNELTPAQLTAPEGALPAPRSLASTTIGRLAELSPDAQLFAGALAVLNQRVSLPTAAQVAAVDDPTRALEGLLSTGFVERTPGATQSEVGFTHPLYRAAVYDDLSPTSRQRLHLAAANALAGTAALGHRVAAADAVDDALADEIDAAASQELHDRMPGLAAAHLLWATSLTSDREIGERRLLEAVQALLSDGQTAQAAALHERVEACAPSSMRELVLGTLAYDQGDAASAEEHLRDAAAIATPDTEDAREARAAALGRLGVIHAMYGRGAEALQAGTAALALHPTRRQTDHDAWGAIAVGTSLEENCLSALTKLAERLPQPAAAVPGEDADLLVTRGSLAFYRGRTADALADLRAAVRLARTTSANQLSRAHVLLAQLLIYTGNWDEAVLNAHLALSLIPDERRVWVEAQAHSVLTTLLASRGEWERAEEHLVQARAAAGQWGTFEAVYTALFAEAALARARGEQQKLADALSLLTRGGDVVGMSVITMLTWWPVLIGALLDLDDADAAESHVDRLEQAAATHQLELGARISALRARIALTRGDTADARTRFAFAVSALGDVDPQLDRALVHHEYGRMLRAVGDRKQAVTQLGIAAHTLANLGAEPYRSRVEADLETVGVRAGATAGEVRSPLALTEREEDVVALVAKGLTNREVATELYVSAKAVEYHLRNVFGKLGIRSRRELRNLSAG